MGDFNIDLLKIDSHADSELSLIPWAPVFFHPHIKFKFKFRSWQNKRLPHSSAFINALLNHKQFLLSCSSLKIKTDRYEPKKELNR